MMNEAEIDALLHVTNSPRYIAGLISVSVSVDTHDAHMMRTLLGTPREYSGRLDALAFRGMSAHEVYVASGRAERDRLEAAFSARLPTVQQLERVTSSCEPRDYEHHNDHCGTDF